MPLLEISLSRQVSASIRLDSATAIQIDQYAAFIHASADDVIDKAVNYVFSKDREFQEFLKTSEAQKVTPLCVDAEPPVPVLLSRPIEAWSRGGVEQFRAGAEGMILHEIRRGARTVLRTGWIMTLHP